MKRGIILCTMFALVSILCFAGGETEETQSSPTKLVFWNISAVDTLRAPYSTAISEFEAQNPDIKVENVPFEPNTFQNTKVPTAVAANDLPDIMFFWGGNNIESFVSKLVPLDDYINDLRPRILGGMTDLATFEGKTYGLPTQVWVAPLFVNKTLFTRYNVKIPENFSEMFEAIKTFKANGVIPWTASGQDAWTLGFYIDNIIVKSAGVQKLIDAATGRISHNDPEIRKGVEFALKCIEAGAFDKSIMGLNRDEAQIPFGAGEVAMYFHGSWYAPELDSATFAAVAFPYDETSIKHAKENFAGCNDFLYVTTACKNIDAGVSAIKYLAEKINMLGYEKGTTLPCYDFSSVPDTSNLSEVVKQVAESSKFSAITNGGSWGFTGVSKTARERYFELYQELVAGKLNVDQFISERDKAAKLK